MISETTPLIEGNGATPYSRTDSWIGRGGGGASYASNVRQEHLVSYYKSVFPTSGVDVKIRRMTVIQQDGLWHCFSRLWRTRVCCLSASAHIGAGGFHVVVDVDGIAAKSFVKTVCGRHTRASGDVLVDGAFLTDAERRDLFGFVGDDPIFVSNLSVEENLFFIARLRIRESHIWGYERALTVSNFTNLDRHQKVGTLNKSQQIRLRIALELVLDPPAIFVACSFDDLDFVEQRECTEVLHRLSRDLNKTVVICTRSLPMPLFSCSESFLLFGDGGKVLYSGKSSAALSFFNELRIPRYVPVPQWRTLAHSTPVESRDDPLNEHQQRTESSWAAGRVKGLPDSRLYLTLCTPPRISSRLCFTDGPTERGTSLEVTDGGDGGDTVRKSAVAGNNVVEVATADDIVDLAKEWMDSQSNTMFYAARYYDSSIQQGLLTMLDNAMTQGGREASSSPLARCRAPSRCMKTPFILASLSIRQEVRDPDVFVGLAFLSLGLIALSIFIHSQPEDQGGMFNIRGMMFTAFTLVLFTNLVTMDGTPDLLRLAVYHRKEGLYGTGSFLFSLLVRLLLVRLVYLVLFLPFIFLVLKSSYSFAVLVCLVSITHALAQCAIALLPSKQWIDYASQIYFGYSIIFSGFLLNLRSLPHFLGALSFLRWGYGAALNSQLRDKIFQCDGIGNTSYCYTGNDYLAFEGLTDDSVANSTIVLSVMSGVLLCGIGLSVIFK